MKTQNVEKVDLGIQEQSELYYSDELRKKLDMYFNEKLKDKIQISIHIIVKKMKLCI